MKYYFAACALLLTSSLCCAAQSAYNFPPLPTGNVLQAAQSPGHFIFVVGGDNRAAGHAVPMPPTAARIFKEIGNIHPAFALWTGDTIYGFTDTPGEAAAEYRHFLTAAQSAGTPIYNVPGNHEIFDRNDLQAVYRKRMGMLYGSFNYGGCHFVALDTEEVGVKGGFSGKQLTWLKNDLAASRGALHTFVFMHHPLYPLFAGDALKSESMRAALQRLFTQYHVDYVFSGHEHIYCTSVHGGVHYIVTGGGGAPMDAPPNKGGFLHYLLVKVDGPTIKTSVLQPWRLSVEIGPKEPNEWQSALVCNYNASAVPVLVEFDKGALTPATAMVQAVWKGKRLTSSIPVEMVTSGEPGRIGARLMVPPGIAVVVSLRPKLEPMRHH